MHSQVDDFSRFANAVKHSLFTPLFFFDATRKAQVEARCGLQRPGSNIGVTGSLLFCLASPHASISEEVFFFLAQRGQVKNFLKGRLPQEMKLEEKLWGTWRALEQATRLRSSLCL